MLHAVIRWSALVAMVACNEPTHDDELLSASRISLEERTTVRIHAGVASVDDLEIDAPATLGVVLVTDGVGPGFELTPSCDAAPGADAEVVVHVRDRRTSRAAALVLSVIDDASDACAANVAFWVEPCAGASCADACMPSPGAPSIAIQKGDDARVCLSVAALDSARPLSDETFALEPTTGAFEVGTTTPQARSWIVRGKPWLVGPYLAHYSALAGGIPINKVVPIDIGQPTDIGIEPPIIGDQLLPREFARVLLPLTVHRFPDATPDCTISIDSAALSPFTCARADARLYNASGVSVARCVETPCGPQAHASFSLSFVPGIDSAPTETLPLTVASGGTSSTTDVAIDVASRAEDLACTGAARVACGDVDGDGVLEVVLGGGSATTCAVSLPGWRADTTQTIDNQQLGNLLTIQRPSAHPEILAITLTSDVRRVTRKSASGLGWIDFLIGYSVPADATPISSTGGVPDFLVGTDQSTSPARARFIKIADGSATNLSVGVSSPVAVGAFLNGAQHDLGIASLGGAVAVSVVGSTLAIDWSTGVPKAGSPTTPVNTGIPSGNLYVAGRRSPGAADDLLLSSTNGPYASAVAELSYQQGLTPPLLLGLTYGAVRSIASAPDGSVLLGSTGGAQMTVYDPLAGSVVYRVIDPVPPSLPGQFYGNAISACLDANGSVAGYVWQIGDGLFRVAQPAIIPESP